MSGEYIDVTPTWEGLLSEALRVLPHSTPEGARQIHALILQAARVADLHVSQVDAAKAGQEEEPNAYTLCAACQGTAHEDEGYTVKGQTVCLGCYHEHSAGLNIFNLELLRGPE
tara:strand:- start:84 stop:425 length:342 start_codon:yes stop_codon:yes gene_type:complete